MCSRQKNSLVDTWVVIVAYGLSPVFEKTLKSLVQAKKPPGFQGVLIVENGPPGALANVLEVYREYLAIRHIVEASSRKCDALNRALAQIKCGLIVFLDDDVTVATELLEYYYTAAQRLGRYHYFGGATGVWYEQVPPAWLLRFLPSSARGLDYGHCSRETLPLETFLGFNWAAFAEDLLQAGGYDRRFGPGSAIPGGDETFMQRALHQIGCKGRYLSEAKVMHYVPKDRCTPEWTLKRLATGAYNRGIIAEDYQRILMQRQRLGLIRSLRKALTHWTTRRDLQQALKLNQEGRFWLRLIVIRVRSFIAGFSYGEKQQPLTLDNQVKDRI